MNLFYDLLIAAALLAPPVSDDFLEDKYSTIRIFQEQLDVLETYALMYPHRNFRPYQLYLLDAEEFYQHATSSCLYARENMLRIIGHHDFLFRVWPKPLEINWE